MTAALVDDYDLVISDLDGVVYVGADAVPGAVSALARLHERGVPVAYATNNASRSAAEVADHLIRLGIPAVADEVVTSAQATARLLAERFPAGSRVLVVGANALAAELAGTGLRPVSSAADDPVAVAQGYGSNVGWAQLAEGCIAVRAGATWVATNADRTLPSPRGPLPGNGSLVAALATALDRQPDLVVGKPGPALFEQAARQHRARRPLVVGDRVDTDIEAANRAGMDSLLVLTGVARPVDVLGAEPARRPTYLAADLTGLFAPAVESRVQPDAGWSVSVHGDEVVLRGTDGSLAALRTLCAAAWSAGVAAPQVRADGPAAAKALAELGLAAPARITAASEA